MPQQKASIYELHVRDFSASDSSVPAAQRGTYAAFTGNGDGMKELRKLAQDGLTHVHLLPVFDMATVPERKADRVEPGCDLASMPADSELQQACVMGSAAKDSFNWGYDPLHYTVPEGSYASEPDGSARIKEFRSMVGGLNGAGLRVVMDVVYNHTHAAGQDPTSVLDRIVPGYYHRLLDDGAVATSTCCANTAPEHAMMGRLVVDSIVTWAKQYKVDGFRFDLMGHHPKANILAVHAVPGEGQPVQGLADREDVRLGVVAHQVEPEAVHPVLLRPGDDGVDDEPAHHRVLGARCWRSRWRWATAAVCRAAGGSSRARSGRAPRWGPALGAWGAVVDHVHHHPQPGPVSGPPTSSRNSLDRGGAVTDPRRRSPRARCSAAGRTPS